MEPKTKYNEVELVTLLNEQNNDASNYLYDNYAGALFTIISQIVKDKDFAKDVLQTAFINIWRNIESYNSSKGRLFTWMLNIARNAAIDKVRSKMYKENQRNVSIEIGENITPNTESNAMINDVGLKKTISKLNDDYRRLIDLSYFQGFTHEEIAKITGLPLGTVKTRIRTALGQLRTLLG